MDQQILNNLTQYEQLEKQFVTQLGLKDGEEYALEFIDDKKWNIGVKPKKRGKSDEKQPDIKGLIIYIDGKGNFEQVIQDDTEVKDTELFTILIDTEHDDLADDDMECDVEYEVEPVVKRFTVLLKSNKYTPPPVVAKKPAAKKQAAAKKPRKPVSKKVPAKLQADTVNGMLVNPTQEFPITL